MSYFLVLGPICAALTCFYSLASLDPAIPVDDWNHNQAGTYIHFALFYMLFVIFGVVFKLSNMALLRLEFWFSPFMHIYAYLYCSAIY